MGQTDLKGTQPVLQSQDLWNKHHNSQSTSVLSLVKKNRLSPALLMEYEEFAACDAV